MKDVFRGPVDSDILKSVLSEVGGDPYRKFNIIFSIMSIIPMLVFFYFLTVQIASIEILTTNVGFAMLVNIFLSTVGYILGRTMIRTFLSRTIDYATEITQYNKRLKVILITNNQNRVGGIIVSNLEIVVVYL